MIFRQILLIMLVLVFLSMVQAVSASYRLIAADTVSESETMRKKTEGAAMTEHDRENMQQGQTESAAGESAADETGKQTPELGLAGHSAGWRVYVDAAHGFRIGHPNGFVVQRQDIARLAAFTPTPIASIFFMNPTMAAGALAGIEPPDLELRVYQAGGADSLRSWLISAGFSSADSGTVTHPYNNASISGLKVCQSTMISPGCSIYLLHSDHVYQLTTLSLEGERMIETFRIGDPG